MPETSEVTAGLLIELARRWDARAGQIRAEPPWSPGFDGKLERFHLLVVQDPGLFSVFEELLTRSGRPDSAVRRKLVTELARVLGQDTRLAFDIARAAQELHPHLSWQQELRLLDQELLAGHLSLDSYQQRRDQVLAAAVVAPADEPQTPRPHSVEDTGEIPRVTTATPPPERTPPQPQQPGPANPPRSFPRATQEPPWGASAPPPILGAPGRRGRKNKRRTAGAFRRWAQDRKARRSDPAETSRFLVAHLPDRTPQYEDVSLVVRVSERPSAWATASSRLSRLDVTSGDARVSILVQASPGLQPLGRLEQVLTVPATGDSEPARFAFRPRSPGLQRVRVLAFAGGTFLAELELEVSVEPGGPSVEGEPVVAALGGVRPRRGEVTLQVRSEGDRTVFQLLSDSYLFEPVLAQASAGDPSGAVERALDTLKQLAIGRGPYSPATARRWMQETGIGLWQAAVPGLIKEQYWQLRDHITSFTIATSHDVIPWELLYPLRPGADHGFLVEQFPVLRRVFGQQRCDRITIAPCTYVVSGRSPANARQEIDALTALLGTAGVVEELDELLDLLSSGRCGPLHFVCHNSFSSQAGSAIAMTGGPFVPGLLNSTTVRNSLAAKSPLVFLNACRTAGSIPEYTRMIGWAQQFMAAGAGAFVGTLWPVRSESAGAFAEAFYGHLHGGEPLGRAALLARRTVVREQPDPTWLAYTVYGDPHAHAH